MKSLISLLLVSLCTQVFAVSGQIQKADQDADLETRHTQFNDYFNWSATEEVTYTLRRSKGSPGKVIVKIGKKFTDASFKTTQHQFDKMKYLGSRSQTHAVKDEIIVELDFSNANELTDGEIEEIVFNLKFADEEIDIKRVQMNSVDSDRSYEIDKDTWGLDDDVDVRYEFTSIERE